ncbi:hypothetical protein BH11PSE11_BH11PSE11_19800 [soil metagenome]
MNPKRPDAHINQTNFAMKISRINPGTAGFVLMLLLASASSQAEIYKWVDANGQTHYSERKEDAGKGKVQEIKVSADPTSGTGSAAQSWKEKDIEFRQRHAKSQHERHALPPVDTTPTPLSNGRSDETNASRCNLAKDVLSGAVRHSNGKPTDKNDRDIAENDIRLFCR